MEHYAVAEWWPPILVVTVWRGDDTSGGFSDQLAADREDQVPAVAAERLARAGWRVVGEWRRDGNEWRADVER